MKDKSPYEPQPRICTCNGSPYTICAVCILKRRRESLPHE